MKTPRAPYRWFGPPLALQIMGLLLAGLVVAQLVTLLLTLLLPPEPRRQTDMTVLARVLAGSAESGSGERALQRAVQDAAPEMNGAGWLTSDRSRRELADLLGRPEADVRLFFFTPLPFAGTARSIEAAAAGRWDRLSLPHVAQPMQASYALKVDYRIAQAGPSGGGGGAGAGGGGFPGPAGFDRFPSMPRMENPAGAGAWPPGIGPTTPTTALTGPDRAGGMTLPSNVTPATTLTIEPQARSAQTVGGAAAQANPDVGLRIQLGAGPVAPPQAAPSVAATLVPSAAAAAAMAPLLELPPAPVVPDPIFLQTEPVGPVPRKVEPRVEALPPTPPVVATVTAVPAAPQPPPGPVVKPAPARPAVVQNNVSPIVPRGLFGFAPPPFVEGDFVAAMRLPDGRWAVVQPVPESFPNAWQRRVLLWFAIAALLVAPAALWFARRLVRPITGFAQAAEQLGRDPTTAVLALAGPAELGRAAIAFNRMQSRLRSFVSDRTAMMGAISHDLRTPLTRLRFRIEEAPEALREGMLQDVGEMEQMISSVLAFIRDASEPHSRERLDLASIVEDVVEDAVFVGKPAVLGELAPVTVDVDAIGMRRLIGNLVENAVKYGERAHVRLFREGADAVAEVSDEGQGLPDEELEKVFQPFYRTAQARKSGESGSGLGLAVCRSIARAHGGDVLLRRGRRGLVAQLRLPLADTAVA